MKINDYLFKERLPLMSKSLDAYSMRVSTIAKNIANINTTDYKTERVKFEELFNQQLALTGAKTNDRHLQMGRNPDPSAEKTTNTDIPDAERYISGENDVNLDNEMAELAKTQIRFQFVSQATNKHFRQLGAAITGIANY